MASSSNDLNKILPNAAMRALSLRARGVPCVVLDRADCIASLWQRRTYDRLRLHLPRYFCELPGMPFPDHYPEYPTKRQFVNYLNAYAERAGVQPRFNQAVTSARYAAAAGLWRVRAEDVSVVAAAEDAAAATTTEYIGRWRVHGVVAASLACCDGATIAARAATRGR